MERPKTVNIELLKADLRATAEACRDAKQERRSAEQALSAWTKANPTAPWQAYMREANKVNTARNVAASLSDDMTWLCVLRAHLRGRTHLTANSVYAPQAEKQIAALLDRYKLKESAA